MRRQFILLIDNSLDDIELIRNAILEKYPDVEFRAVPDSEQAFEWLQLLEADRLPTLILLDLIMPRLNGLELLAKFRVSSTLRGARVVALSSSPDPMDLNRARAAGVEAYAKPSTFAALCGLMRRVIGDSAASTAESRSV